MGVLIIVPLRTTGFHGVIVYDVLMLLVVPYGVEAAFCFCNPLMQLSCKQSVVLQATAARKGRAVTNGVNVLEWRGWAALW